MCKEEVTSRNHNPLKGVYKYDSMHYEHQRNEGNATKSREEGYKNLTGSAIKKKKVIRITTDLTWYNSKILFVE